jgi:hypothetical protein
VTILTDDLATIFADTALTVPVESGLQSSRGFLKWEDVPEQDADGGYALVSRRVVLVATAAFTGLTVDSSITVAGSMYRIRDLRRAGTGDLLKVVLV